MPLLDGSRTSDAVAVTASVHNGIPVIDGIDPTTENGRHNDDPNRRQKIVVVGLGMVAVAFMCVQVCKLQLRC
jgi:nitrite reductase (NAD(P)H)